MRGRKKERERETESQETATKKEGKKLDLDLLPVLSLLAHLAPLFLLSRSLSLSLSLSRRPKKLTRIDLKIKKVLLDGQAVKLQIWDTAGQERFRTITASYYRSAMGVLLVYDVGDRRSFESVRGWMRAVDSNAVDGVVRVSSRIRKWS